MMLAACLFFHQMTVLNRACPFDNLTAVYLCALKRSTVSEIFSIYLKTPFSLIAPICRHFCDKVALPELKVFAAKATPGK
jgi:hypothetical protein